MTVPLLVGDEVDISSHDPNFSPDHLITLCFLAYATLPLRKETDAVMVSGLVQNNQYLVSLKVSPEGKLIWAAVDWAS